MSTTTSRTQPALIGGLIIGILSALPLVSAANLCCCLWVVSGGLVAAYILQESQATPITAADGAYVGLLAGMTGAVVYLLLSIPITYLIAPMERLVLQRLMEGAGEMPPEIRDAMSTFIGGGVRVALGFIFMLFAGSVFATLGGLLGAAIFRKQLPPGTVDVSSAR